MIACLLSEMINNILYKKETQTDGTVVEVDRDIPFRLKYALNKNVTVLDSWVNKYAEYQMYVKAKYGEQTEDGKDVKIVDEDKQKQADEDLTKYLRKEIDVSIYKINDEDIATLMYDDLKFDSNSIKIFTAYLVKDDEYLKELIDITNNFEKE